nr:6599_t:CDS:2 [Entrophospora candida]
MDDLGLTDGECLERLWSNLRYFIPITRYMRPNHRLDVLDSVLYCISNNMIDNLAISLVKRFRKAKAIKINSLKILQEKFTAHAINEQDIAFAINKQKELINSNNIYKEQLYGYDFNKNQINAKEKQLSKLEEDFGISQRWRPLDEINAQFLKQYSIRNLNKYIEKLRSLEVEYTYNSVALYKHGHIGNYPEASLEQIIKNTSKFWKFTVSSSIQIKDVSHDEIFDIIIEYHNLNRANEEIKMIPKEMERTIEYWKRIESNIVDLTEDLKQRKNLSINELGLLLHLNSTYDKIHYRINDSLKRFQDAFENKSFFYENSEILHSNIGLSTIAENNNDEQHHID